MSDIRDVRDDCPVYDGISDCTCGEHEPILPHQFYVNAGRLPLPMDLAIGRPNCPQCDGKGCGVCQ
jgi:hypothetical protein